MRDYTYSPYFGKNIISSSSKVHKKAIFVLIIFVAIAAYLLISKLTFFHSTNAKHSVVPSPMDNKTTTKFSSAQDLMQKIETKISQAGGTYSIYIYDINNKKEYGVNGQTIFTAASLNKLPILAALYYLAGKNQVDLEKIIVPQPSDIQDYGTGSIRYDPPGTPYSIKTLARLMMEKSDNTAAYILGSLIIGPDKIQALTDSWELTQTDIADNKTSAKDMATLVIMMYKGEITNPALTAEMLGFMDKSDFDDRIPKGIPAGIKVYHKIGDEVGKIHDVGIIDLPNKPYYLGILTSDMTNEEQTKNTIALISEWIFEFMTHSINSGS
ncbi:serine hydrolase [Candidatus Gottesmanbacteria bacterium]|nr:serine hydrolase [Candidatus Gottesmanbacteria bacterium]